MPDTIGNQLPQPDRIRGWLVFDHLPDDLQKAEDSTRFADAGALHTIGNPIGHVGGGITYRPNRLVRTVTGTELILLEHLGYDTAKVTQTVVRGRHRSWPCLEDTPRPPEERTRLKEAGYTDHLPN